MVVDPHVATKVLLVMERFTLLLAQIYTIAIITDGFSGKAIDMFYLTSPSTPEESRRLNL